MADEIALPVADGEVEEQLPGSEEAETPLGPYQKPDEELIVDLRAWWKESADSKSKSAPLRKLDWAMYAGHQWEQADKERMTLGKRPALTLNMILAIVSAVEGEERTNRQELKAYGVGSEDDAAGEGFTQIIKWINQQADGQFANSQQFRGGIICGEHWIVPEVDYFDDPEGKIKPLSIDEDEMFDDPLGKCPVGSDSRYLTRVKYITMEEGEARWPGFRQKIVQNYLHDHAESHETDPSGFRDIYSTPGELKSMKIYDAQRKLWAVAECWWWQIEPGVIVVNEETGLLEEKTPEEFEAMKVKRQEEQRQFLNEAMMGTGPFSPPPMPVPGVMPDPTLAAAPFAMPAMPAPVAPKPLQAKERPVKNFYQAFHCYNSVLAKQPSPLRTLKRFPYVPFRALWDKTERDWFGIVRSIIDPQKQHNIEQSIIVQLMQLMPKQSWMGPKGSFHNKNDWQEKVAQPGAVLEYNSQRGKPEPIPVQPIPRHLIDMAFTRPQTMRDISGVNVELTGQRQGSDPGVVMEQRQRAAKTVLAPIFDNYRWSKLTLGRVYVSMIQAYVSPGRRFRIIGEDNRLAYVQATTDMQVGRYDVAMEETNSTITDRIATLNILQTTLPTMMKAGVPLIPEFIDLMPMPPHVRDPWKRQIAWEMAISGRTPPPGWQPGMPVPLPSPAMPPGGDPAATEAPPVV